MSHSKTGEIQVYGSMTGSYWNNDQANADLYSGDGWLHTGDLGYLDEGLVASARTQERTY